MRELLRKLSRERGITMLVSSHLLSELHQLATCYGFIRNGKMLEEITSDELSKKCRKYLSVKVDQVAKAETVLRTMFQLQNLEMISGGVLNVYDMQDKLETGAISRALVLAGINVEAVTVKDTKLDDYYLSLIGKNEESYLAFI